MRPSPRTWLVPASALILVALFVADLMTRDDTVLVALYALGPLIAVLGGGPRAVAAVGALALALAVAHTLDDDMSSTAQDVVRARDGGAQPRCSPSGSRRCASARSTSTARPRRGSGS